MDHNFTILPLNGILIKKAVCFHPTKPPTSLFHHHQPSFPPFLFPFHPLLLSPISLLERSTIVLDFKILDASLGNLLLFYQHGGLSVALNLTVIQYPEICFYLCWETERSICKKARCWLFFNESWKLWGPSKAQIAPILVGVIWILFQKFVSQGISWYLDHGL